MGAGLRSATSVHVGLSARQMAVAVGALLLASGRLAVAAGMAGRMRRGNIE